MTDKTIHHSDWQGIPKPLISTVTIAIHGGHADVKIWNRGGCAGSICVNADDAQAILDRLIPVAMQIEEQQ